MVKGVRTGVFIAGHVSCFPMSPYSLWTSSTGMVGSRDHEMNSTPASHRESMTDMAVDRLWGGMGRKEGNVLFNDALNTFYLRLYGVIHMVKDHSDSERGNPLPPHGLLFPISSKGSFICIIPQRG